MLRAFPCGESSEERGRPGSDVAEHVTVFAHRVIRHKQIVSEAFVVEIAGKIAHYPVKVVALVDDMLGEVFFAFPFSAVSVLEIVERVVILHIVIDGIGIVLFAQFRVFEDIVEVLAAHEALVIPLAREALEVLRHQLRVVFVGVNSLAEVYKFVVVAEAR